MSVCQWGLEVIAVKTERERAAIKALGFKGTSLLKSFILKTCLLSQPVCRNMTAFLKTQRFEGGCVIEIHLGTREFS